MLTSLQVKNLLTIENLELDFYAGLTVITGETGAGKSILVEAMALILGQRAQPALIRQGAEKCEITAFFDLHFAPHAMEWLKAHELLAPPETTLLIRRILTQEGHSKIYINHSLTTVALLQQLGNFLIHTHTQQQHQTLLSTATQRELLDSFGQHIPLLDGVRKSYAVWQKAEEDFKIAQTLASQQLTARELLSYQVKELDALALQENELSSLEQKYHRLIHLEKLFSHIRGSLNLLEEKDEGSAQETLLQTIRLLQEISEYEGSLQTPIELLKQAHIYVQETVTHLKSCLNKLDIEPEELLNVSTRLECIHQLVRKHNIKAPDLPSFHKKLKCELAELEALEPKIAELGEAALCAKQTYCEKANQLTCLRQATSLCFEKALLPYLKQLGMPYGKFKVHFSPCASGEETAEGLEKVEWLITTNPDHPLKPLKQVVSGGELSRISLAIEALTTTLLPTPTFLFDEVDVGVGGKTADTVGRLLKKLGERKQVICVTHLAQVAVWGSSHIRVEKTVQCQVTYSTVHPLNEEERVLEIARMVGGKSQTPETLQHARKMLTLV